MIWLRLLAPNANEKPERAFVLLVDRGKIDVLYLLGDWYTVSPAAEEYVSSLIIYLT